MIFAHMERLGRSGRDPPVADVADYQHLKQSSLIHSLRAQESSRIIDDSEDYKVHKCTVDSATLSIALYTLSLVIR